MIRFSTICGLVITSLSTIAHVAGKVADVLSGGDCAEGSYVSEQLLLDLEREAFLSLCGEAKTQDRIMYMLKNGKAV